MTGDELTAEQAAWRPTSPEELLQCWPYGHKAEMLDGVVEFSTWEPWDWRSMALAARAYPGAVVTLEDPGYVLTVALG